MIIDCIGCLHGDFPTLDGGDLLIVTGDLTYSDTLDQHYDAWEWLHAQPYKKVVLVAGNHDGVLQTHPNFYRKAMPKVQYLQDSGIEFEGLRIWGSPWTHVFHGQNPRCMAFALRDDLLHDKFNEIPLNADILVTHGPPLFHLSAIERHIKGIESREECGSYALNEAVKRIKPKLHVFSHIHEAYGEEKTKRTHFVNCSRMNGDYEPVNAPIRVVL